MEKRVLGIFTCFNRKNKTISCLESLARNHTIIDFIAVDDGSTDGTAEALARYDNVTVLNGNGSLFYSGGMRRGIEEAKKRNLDSYDYVMFLNDDVCFFENAIDRMISGSDGKSIIVGAMCDDNGNLSYGGAVKTSKYKPSFKNVMSSPEQTAYCDTFCANCVLIPVPVFKKLPNMDKVYIHAMGDFDYGLEASRRGYPITATDFFTGTCNDNPITNTWDDPSLKIRDRLRKKESPKGLPFRDYFHFINKNYGFLSAVLYSLTPYVRIFLGK